MKHTYNELHDLVTQWGKDRNFYAPEGATYTGQFIKLFEEAGELAMGIAKNKLDVIKDSVGDMLVVCIMLQHIAERDGTLTNLKKFSLYDQIPFTTGEHKPHTLLYFIANDIVWLSPDNRTTTYKGGYMQRMVSHLCAISEYYGFTLTQALSHAYNEIKDRKGQMVDGVFIKQSDL